MRWSRTWRKWAVAALVSVAACGDSGATPSGEKCDVPGTSDRCLCDGIPVGRHTCLDSHYYGDCACPATASGGPCMPGVSECSPCPGETASRPAKCTDAGAFDCSCGTTGMPAADGGSGSPSDAGGAGGASGTGTGGAGGAPGDDAGDVDGG